MKKIPKLFLWSLLFWSFESSAQTITITDTAFVTFLTSNAPSCMSGNILNINCASSFVPPSYTFTINAPVVDLNGIQYFDSLKKLYLTHTHIDTILQFPSGLKLLDFSFNDSLRYIDNLPFYLQELFLIRNAILSNFPIFPSSLQELTMSSDTLEGLLNLPVGLKRLILIGASSSPNVNPNLITINSFPSSMTDIKIWNATIPPLPSLPPYLGTLNVRNCGLTTLPSLPSTLYTLDCAINQISTIPILPNGLENLYIFRNPITTLPTLPPNLIRLMTNDIIDTSYLNQLSGLNYLVEFICGDANLTNIPSLPPNLQHWYCYNNLLTSLPNLPASLKTLNCENNLIDSLPSMPPNLISLVCSNNLLDSLPSLPNTLANLYISQNYNLSYLPSILPSSLARIYANQCNFDTLPSLPSSIYELQFNNNFQLGCLPYLPNNLQYLYIDSTQINCLPNTVSNLYCSTNITAICNGGSACDPHPTILGKMYLDNNSNGLFDTGIDSLISNHGLIVNQTNNEIAVPVNGMYFIKLDYGVSNSIIPGFYPYCTFNPANYNITPTTSGTIGFNYDYAVSLIPNIKDLRVTIAHNTARPGFNQQVNLLAKNMGTNTPSNVVLKLLKPNNFSFLSSTPAPSSIIGDTLMYSGLNFGLFENKVFTITLTVPSTVALGTPYQLDAWIEPVVNDSTPANNYYLVIDSVKGSYDPNNKLVSQSILNNIPVNDDLVYTINFQNTGTDTAFQVIIKDTLSNMLELSSFNFIGASHNCSYQFLDSQLLEITFNNILLPDSNTNEPLSHGFFQYSLKPKSSIQLTDEIENTAHIYFDNNLPIVTNTVTTVFASPTHLNCNSVQRYELRPNPNNGEFFVDIDSDSFEYEITNLWGQVMKKGKANRQDSIDIHHLANGVYLIKVESNNHFRTKKILKY
jgi:uncharacterized repeat protein (TIGR01451 family)